MDASRSASSDRARAAAALLAGLGVCLGACTSSEPGARGTTSLRVDVVAPSDLGSDADRLSATVDEVTVSITAVDAQGLVDETLEAEVTAYPQFLGTISDSAVEFVTLVAGEGQATVSTRNAFGPTVVWVEDADESAGRDPTWAVGASATLWFRDPYLADISTPDPASPSVWLSRSPLETKQVEVRASRHGASGRLVVTGVYSQAYSLSDMRCTSRPCTVSGAFGPTGDPQFFDHLLVYTFSRPRANGRDLAIGDQVARVAGGVVEFNGLTELSFPSTALASDDPDEGLIPADANLPSIDAAWLNPDVRVRTGMINLEALEGALVQVAGATVCPLDDEWETFKQWELLLAPSATSGPTGTCDDGDRNKRAVSVVTAGAVNDLDPATLVGDRLTRVVGTLRSVDTSRGVIWILYPRRASDIVP